MEVRSQGFRTDLMVRRLAGSSITDRGDHLVVRTPDNPWFHWGNFLLLDAPPEEGAIEEWIAVFSDEFPGATHIAIGVDGTEFPEPWSYPSSVGLEADLSEVLILDGPPRRGSVSGQPTMRELRSDRDWHQESLLRREVGAADTGLAPGHAEFLQRSTAEASRLVGQGRAAYFGAFDGDRLCSVAGIASDGRGVARFQNIATHPDYRRRGFASELVSRTGVFGTSSMEADRLIIVAETGGPAARLYRSLGFVPTESQLGLSAAPVS